MKKIIAAILAAVVISISASGCMGMGAKPAVATGDEAKSQNAADYPNTYEGLCNYLASFGYINPLKDNVDSTYVVMDYALVGAAHGRRYTEQTKKKATIEIYDYTDVKSATADEILAGVKDKGTFTVLGLPEVKAILSNNGKYMMVYNDKSIDENNKEQEEYKLREEIVEKFKTFHE